MPRGTDPRPLLRPVATAAATLLLIAAATLRTTGDDAQDARGPYAVTAPPAGQKVDPFYKKQVDLGGLPVQGSGAVNDYALKEAAYLIDRMLADRPDILKALVERKARFVVMAATERTTDLPEQRDMTPKDFWNVRARGLGASRQKPIVSCGEENLLNLKGDPYKGENIFIHEFAHAIHGLALRDLDPTFDRRLREAFDRATEKSLWQGTYALSNPGEYWAEAVQSWFDCNLSPPDFQHNEIHTREALKAYDPGVSALVAEVFGDKPWRYIPPRDRKDRDGSHLAGFDPDTAPAFAWGVDEKTKYDEVVAEKRQLRKKEQERNASPAPSKPILDKQKLLDAQTFWDNRDWDWYKANIPFFECPDPAITTNYYYRWELVTKHMTYGSPSSGYSFTEFIDRPFWSGAYGAISCPAGHQLYEIRWLRDPRYAKEYSRYWFKTPGAQPRNYSTWLADAIWAAHQVHPDRKLLTSLLDDMKRNYEGWEERHFVPEVGLFWQTGHDDGMEFNINSRQTADILRGAPAFRPTLNSYMIADALAIARVADLSGDDKTAATYREKAADLEKNMLEKLWDPKRQFFFPMSLRDEERDGHTVKAGSLTYQTGQYAGDPHGREEIGFVPWQFNIPKPGKESAWKGLMDPDVFFAPFGPTVVERHDPLFKVTDGCCWWSGQSWPYATTQTLKAMANLIQSGVESPVTKKDYNKLLSVYTKTHHKDGRPYIAEGVNPDTGSWQGYDAPNHSEHYFHSGYNDLIITGLVGLQPSDGDTITVNPLAPDDWDYFALDDVKMHGHRVSVVWDRDGTRYGLGKGLRILADGRAIGHRDDLGKLTATLPPASETGETPPPVNFAVNNDGDYYPRVSASFSNSGTPISKAIDGNSWYHVVPTNRWTTEGSPNATDWFAVDFGTPRRIDSVSLKFLDDGDGTIASPTRFDLEFWDGNAWKPVPDQARTPEKPTGHRGNLVRFPTLETSKLRAVFIHRGDARTGLAEFEAWGDGSQSIAPAAPPTGNLAFNPGGKPFPKASASYTSRFDSVERANDGRVNFNPNPPNRWTAYESSNAEDWLQIDFGEPKSVSRLELALFDDRGGVQAPTSYRVEYLDGQDWRPVTNSQKSPETPSGGSFNEVRFDRVTTPAIRVVFVHKGQSRSGVSELLAWPE